VTPISPSVFIAAQILARLVAALTATVAMLALAVALGADVEYTASLLWIVPLVAVAVLTGVSFGFAIAGAMSTPEAANQLNIALFTPVFMLAGIMYPLDGMPEAVRDAVIYAIPFAAVVDAFRGMVDGLPITDFIPQAATALAWLGAAFGLAIRSYRFVERPFGASIGTPAATALTAEAAVPSSSSRALAADELRACRLTIGSRSLTSAFRKRQRSRPSRPLVVRTRVSGLVTRTLAVSRQQYRVGWCGLGARWSETSVVGRRSLFRRFLRPGRNAAGRDRRGDDRTPCPARYGSVVNGHRFLPSGGHRFSPLADMFSPRWWPSVLPSAPVVAEPSA
jgi:hypothetical protein